MLQSIYNDFNREGVKTEALTAILNENGYQLLSQCTREMLFPVTSSTSLNRQCTISSPLPGAKKWKFFSQSLTLEGYLAG
jgi:hypothetical protein